MHTIHIQELMGDIWNPAKEELFYNFYKPNEPYWDFEFGTAY